MPHSVKLVFLHIPKCGGTSVRHALAERFEPDEICPERFHRLDKFSDSEMQRFRFFSGHFSMTQVNKIPGEKYLITTLRDPRERIISLYYFWRRHAPQLVERAGLAGPRIARQLSLVEFLAAETSPPRSAVKNAISCALAGGVFPGKGEEYHVGAPGSPKRIERHEVLRRALDALKQFHAVGFLDDPDALVQRVCVDLALGEPRQVGRLNTKEDQRPGFEPVTEEVVTPEIFALLNECTDLDRIVYDAAVACRERK